jgi:hypothetical protein
MENIERRKYEMLIRVRDFGDAHQRLFPASSLAKDQFAAIDAAVKALSLHAATKMSAARAGRNDKAAARAALVTCLEAITKTARAVGQDTAGLEDKFRMPEHQTDQAILTTGRVFAQDAAAFASQFIGHAMPSTFIADLNGLVDQFDQAIRGRQAEKDDQTAARASIEAALASGFVALHKLDAIVTNHLKGDPVTLAVWRGDRRVEYRVRKRSAGKTAAPNPATPAAASGSATASADAAVAPKATEH